jgi:hypothetical protein
MSYTRRISVADAADTCYPHYMAAMPVGIESATMVSGYLGDGAHPPPHVHGRGGGRHPGGRAAPCLELMVRPGSLPRHRSPSASRLREIRPGRVGQAPAPLTHPDPLSGAIAWEAYRVGSHDTPEQETMARDRGKLGGAVPGQRPERGRTNLAVHDFTGEEPQHGPDYARILNRPGAERLAGLLDRLDQHGSVETRWAAGEGVR